jgi:hypothetical protein
MNLGMDYFPVFTEKDVRMLLGQYLNFRPVSS